MPICRLAYADFKMAYADTFIGRFAVGGLLDAMDDVRCQMEDGIGATISLT